MIRDENTLISLPLVTVPNNKKHMFEILHPTHNKCLILNKTLVKWGMIVSCA